MSTHKEKPVNSVGKAPTGTPTSINIKDIFTAPRKDSDPDLVAITYENIKQTAGKVAANLFLEHPIIKEAHLSNPIVQRVMINKYLSRQLMLYRGASHDRVYHIIGFVTNESTIDVWFKIMKNYIIPFHKETGFIVYNNNFLANFNKQDVA